MIPSLVRITAHTGYRTAGHWGKRGRARRAAHLEPTGRRRTARQCGRAQAAFGPQLRSSWRSTAACCRGRAGAPAVSEVSDLSLFWDSLHSLRGTKRKKVHRPCFTQIRKNPTAALAQRALRWWSYVFSRQAPGIATRLHQFSRYLAAAIFLGVLRARENPRIVPIELPFVFAFFTFASSALSTSTRSWEKALVYARVAFPDQEDSAGVEERGRARANRCCFSPGQGPGRGKLRVQVDLRPAALPAELLAGRGLWERATRAFHRGPRGQRVGKGGGGSRGCRGRDLGGRRSDGPWGRSGWFLKWSLKTSRHWSPGSARLWSPCKYSGGYLLAGMDAGGRWTHTSVQFPQVPVMEAEAVNGRPRTLCFLLFTLGSQVQDTLKSLSWPLSYRWVSAGTYASCSFPRSM